MAAAFAVLRWVGEMGGQEQAELLNWAVLNVDSTVCECCVLSWPPLVHPNPKTQTLRCKL